MTRPDPHPLLHERTEVGAARLAARHEGRFSIETVQALIDDSHQRLAATARITAHLNVLAERLSAERLDALASSREPIGMRPARVLFVCGHNSGRSQLAAALLAHRFAGPITISSAGTTPAAELDPRLAEVLTEVGADLGDAYPKPLTTEVVGAADIVVTLGCGDACPVVPGRHYLDWPVADPHASDLAGWRRVRDVIDTHITELLTLLAMPAVPETK
ncbi:low molecular weight phosphatase family protein [Nocardiopsis sp. HUAS JQ3]|uniref:arsenate-mycothiol transferase ArsC n=1 Tax=Nocardiopsis sp. HUAS JQ3 TaxID=3061629 RepID=UPI0023A9A214|nr:arsenate reductase ArsC [Nocardiopsis sp. HUAS JQ3]WDZ88793.1 arsenate reductase ArsC [Nocardiopsis sp. HUAS JQ3]